MSSTETQTKQIQGVCEEISEKNGWTSFAINVGSQYPVRLSTKLPALVEQARAVGSEQALWTFKESQGGENPNKPGTFYTNRYLEGAEAGGTVTQSSTPVQPADPVVDWDAKERRDYRSRAWAQTLGAFTHTIKVDEDPAAVFARLQPFQRKVFEDVCQSFAHPADESDIPF